MQGEHVDNGRLLPLNMVGDNIADLSPSIDEVKLRRKYEEMFDVKENDKTLKETDCAYAQLIGSVFDVHLNVRFFVVNDSVGSLRENHGRIRRTTAERTVS